MCFGRLIHLTINKKAGNRFSNLSQRYIYSIVATFPSYRFNKECGVDETAQCQMHGFLSDLVQLIYEQPSLIDMPDVPDSYDGEWENRDEFLKNCRKVESKFVCFVELLTVIGIKGNVENDSMIVPISPKIKKNLSVLEAIGLNITESDKSYIIQSGGYPKIFEAWKALSLQEYKTKTVYLRNVIRNIYDKNETYTAEEIFGELLPNREALSVFDHYFSTNGYTLSNGKQVHMIAEWLKEYPKEKRSRFQVNFAWTKYNPINFTFMMPEIKGVMDHFDEFSDEMKRTFIDMANLCSGCRFCLQTDKTKTKSIECKKVVFEGKDYTVCTLFPLGQKTEVDLVTADSITQMFSLADSIASKGK